MESYDQLCSSILGGYDHALLNKDKPTEWNYSFNNVWDNRHCKAVLCNQIRLIELNMADTRRLYNLRELRQAHKILEEWKVFSEADEMAMYNANSEKVKAQISKITLSTTPSFDFVSKGDKLSITTTVWLPWWKRWWYKLWKLTWPTETVEHRVVSADSNTITVKPKE